MSGPNLPQADHDAALAQAPAGVDVFRFRKDFPSLLAAAELSVSQAGYNTVCDVLQAGCRAILVPFAAGGETEQTVRAERLQRLGLAASIAETELSPAVLGAAIERQLAAPKPASHALDLDGARKSAVLLRRLVAKRIANSTNSEGVTALLVVDKPFPYSLFAIPYSLLAHTLPDQHEAIVFLHRQRAGETQLGEIGQRCESLDRFDAADVGRLAEIVVRLQQHAGALRQQIEPCRGGRRCARSWC